MSRFRPPELPRIRRAPAHGNVLVLAPHPDDETMGLGGTLALHAAQGDPITAVFVCSGIQGDPDGYIPRDQVEAVRQEEARAAARILGIKELRFLGYPDNLSDADIHIFEGLPEDPDEARRTLAEGFARWVENTVETERFDIVYYPWEEELNLDHWVIGRAVTHLIAARGDLLARVAFLAYDVWSPLIPETVIDTSDVIETKIRAVACYASQQRYLDYRHPVLGLDAYRSILLERGARFGEAFRGHYRDHGSGAEA